MDDDKSQWEAVPVVLSGGGPVGSLLSAYLSQYAIKHVVLEKELQIPPDPRAFSMGEDSIRALQSVGLYDCLYSELGQPVAWGSFVGGRHSDLNHPPFLRIKLGASGYTGHPQNLMFRQPILEEKLRSIVSESDYGDFRAGCALVSVEQADNWVYLRYEDAKSKEQHQLRAKFLVGADGKRGFVRKQYLEPLGVTMKPVHPYEETYMAMNWDITLPTRDTHPDFPLWKLSYSPEEVYDAFFPRDFKFIANPDRPGCASRIGVPTDNPRLWRFEFDVKALDDTSKLSDEDQSVQIVRSYMLHSGSRYDLPQDVRFPDDCMKLRSCAPYRFQARICNKWSIGRVMLAGDSAHVFPPFGGQGIQAGFMDVQGLSWRLAVALQPHNNPVDTSKLFESWANERKEYIEKQLIYTIRNGDLLTEQNEWKMILRDWILWLLQLIPLMKARFEKLPLDPPKYTGDVAHAFLPDLKGGQIWEQLYCVPLGERRDVMFTDDVIFRKGQLSLFQLVVIISDVGELGPTIEHLTSLRRSKEGVDLFEEATYLFESTEPPTVSAAFIQSRPRGAFARLATSDEFAQSRLCVGREPPEDYDETKLGTRFYGKQFIIVRPDRFVFAACKNAVDLEIAMDILRRVLRCQ